MNADALISFTQLYTPQWVVDTLIAQHAALQVRSQETNVAGLNIIDPACAAEEIFSFLLLKRCWRNVLRRRDVGIRSSAAFVKGALSGVDIDPMEFGLRPSTRRPLLAIKYSSSSFIPGHSTPGKKRLTGNYSWHSRSKFRFGRWSSAFEAIFSGAGKSTIHRQKATQSRVETTFARALSQMTVTIFLLPLPGAR